MASALCVLNTESAINDRFTYNNRFSTLHTKNHAVSVQTYEIMFLNHKKGGHLSPPKKRKGRSFYGRFLCMRIISAPTRTMTTMMAMTAGMKYWSVMDDEIAVACGVAVAADSDA